jgi:hypothetical protein
MVGAQYNLLVVLSLQQGAVSFVQPQRPGVELLDGSAGTSGSGTHQCPAGENVAWSGCRCPRVRTLAAYKDFLTLWKDADPDIPILKEAKAEYAKLQ